jgi:catechol 2,3-dioxygenase-like lactoylglutathione lyase family enzyme
MKKFAKVLVGGGLMLAACAGPSKVSQGAGSTVSNCTNPTAATAGTAAAKPGDGRMSLGNFSVSLAVKDLAASRAFYEKLGFHVLDGGLQKHFWIMQSDTATIGLFQGMFEKNIMTFNPGWDRTGTTLGSFDDIRAIQRDLVARGLTPTISVDEKTTGPGSLMVVDPDGNPILIDQHAASPATK